jgi:hypothetical protein
LDHDTENETEKEQGLDQGKEESHHNLLPLPPDETFWILPENDLERRPNYCKKSCGEEKEKKKAERAGEPLGQGDEIQLSENFFAIMAL